MLQVILVPDSGDERGSSHSVPAAVLQFLGQVSDIHLTTVVSSAIRGNHFHVHRREALIVTNETAWTFYWDEGEDTPPKRREFEKAGTTVILIQPGQSHAIENTGQSSLSIIGLSSEPYDPSETIARKISQRQRNTF
jgi:dTDP-4-dehydrorhamnose 3,5-epimerase-like enzyme